MATHTSNYGWTKPSGNDNVDISVLNDNLDDQDNTIHDAFLNMAPPFSESSTYAVDDIVLYGTGLYKCHTAVVTPGSWTGSTNWQVYKLSEGGSGGGGGTSDYNPLTNKPQINGVTLLGNKTTSDLGITASGVGAIPSTDKGANGGVAELDSNGKVPSSQLPSYVDDVLSYSSQSAFPATGETGKIYIAEDTNKTYRWSGSAYAEISASLALGETSSTAYRGDRGKTAYDHSQIVSGNPHGTTAADVGLGNVPNVTTNNQIPTFTEASTRNNIASGDKLSVILGKVQKFFNDLKTVAFSGSYTDLSNKPSIPTKTSDITNDSNFVSDANYVHTDNNFTTSEKTKLAGIASGAEANVQANWSQTNTSADDFIKNKPSLATVATSGSYADLSNKPTIPTSAAGISYDNTDSGLSATDVQGAVDEVNSSKMNYNTPHYTGVLSNDAYDTTSTDQFAKQVLNVQDGQNLVIGNGISCDNIYFQTKSTDIPLSNIVKIIYDQVEPINVETGGATTYNFYSRADSMKPQGMKLLAGIYAGAYPMQTWSAQCILVRVRNEIENSKIEVSLQSIGQAQNYGIGIYYIYIPA